jgi:arylsulfatase A-like enzyme
MKSNCFSRFGRALIAVLLTGAVLPGFTPGVNAQLSFVLTNQPPHALPRRPSIILIVADGLGYGDLSCYGQTRFQTPNLDWLAAQGIRFTNYYAGAAASSPARAALLLGRDSDHLRQHAGADVPLAPGEVTVEQLLKQSGYHTGLIGEWDLGDDTTGGAPWEKGFDEFAGYLDPNDVTNYYADYLWRFDSRSSYEKTSGKWIKWVPAQGPPAAGKEMIYSNTRGKNQYIPDLLTKAALNFVKNNQPDQFNSYRPFFLLLNYALPAAGNGSVPTDAPYSEEPWPQPQKNKAAMISRLDGYVGQLREQLQDLGLTNNVVIFFTSDTGPQKGAGADPGFFQSVTASNSLRVPMIVRWPDSIPAGQVSAYAWTASDFLPTVADIALTRATANIDGRSVLPTLLGQTQTNRHNF